MSHLLSATSLKEVSLLIRWFHQTFGYHVDQQTCGFSYSKMAKRVECVGFHGFLHSCSIISSQIIFSLFFVSVGYLMNQPSWFWLLNQPKLRHLDQRRVAQWSTHNQNGWPVLEMSCWPALYRENAVWLRTAFCFNLVQTFAGCRLLTSSWFESWLSFHPLHGYLMLTIHPILVYTLTHAGVIKPGNFAINCSIGVPTSGISAISLKVSRWHPRITGFHLISDLANSDQTMEVTPLGIRCLRRFHVLTGEEILKKLSQYPESLELGSELLICSCGNRDVPSTKGHISQAKNAEISQEWNGDRTRKSAG